MLCQFIEISLIRVNNLLCSEAKHIAFRYSLISQSKQKTYHNLKQNVFFYNSKNDYYFCSFLFAFSKVNSLVQKS